MYSVNGTTIEMTRGDTVIIIVSMKRGTQTYTPQEGDSIRFALKRAVFTRDGSAYIDPEPLILKSIPNDTLELRLNPEDTKGLGFGEYVYDIEITFANGNVDTFIANASFLLEPEVH